MRILVAGWFSFKNGHATAGDLLTRDLACEWLDSGGYRYEVALAHPFQGGVDLAMLDPNGFTHVVFVCGPFGKAELEAQILSRFRHCRLIGLNLSMLLPLNEWNPFDFLIERDSTRSVNPDMAFLSRQPLVPVVGVCLVEDYQGGLTQITNAAIDRLKQSRTFAAVPIDTRLDSNSSGLRSPVEIESLLARMDVVLTTRLHGTVLALKNGVPVVPIDPEPGGKKIRRQVDRIGWPVNLWADDLTDAKLEQAFDFCLTKPARLQAIQCAERASLRVMEIRHEFIETLKSSEIIEATFKGRQTATPDDEWMKVFAAPDSEPAPPMPSAPKTIRSRIAGLLRRS